MPYPQRGDDRDRDQRGVMRDEDQGYQDSRDRRGHETWRTEDRYDRRFDHDGEERFADRPFEMDRMRGQGDQDRRGYHGPDHFDRERSDRNVGMGLGRPYDEGAQGMYGQRGDVEQGGGWYGQGGHARGYAGQGGYPGQGGGYAGQRSGYAGQGGGYAGQDGPSGRYAGQDGPSGSYAGQGGPTGSYAGQGGQTGSYAGQGGQTGSQAGYMSSRMRGPHHGKGPAGFQRSDERIKELVCEALTDDDDVDATNIEVNVKGGEVTLTGTVEDRGMKRLAEQCVENVRGVKDVQNQLRISAEQKPGASSITGTCGTRATSPGGASAESTTGTAGSASNEKNDQAEEHRPS